MPLSFETLDDSQKSLILKHLSLVLEANEITNLTRIESPEEGKLLHIEDSLSALDLIANAPQGKYIDLGSGGGYPGIPLAIGSGRKTILLDAREKKALLLTGFIEELGLDNQIEAVHARIEDYSKEHKGEFAVVTARALAKLSVLLEFASPLLRQGGNLICYKAHIEGNEWNHANKVARIVGMKLVSKQSFTLSDNETFRTLVVAEKIGTLSLKLPRHDGYAQKKPL